MRLLCSVTAAIGVAVLLVLLTPVAAAAADPAGDAPGYIQVSSNPPGATVFVNMARMNGVTPITIPVPAGQPEEVVVNLYGYEAARRTVTVQPNETLPLAFELTILPGGQLGTETPGAAGSPTRPPGEQAAPAATTRAIWTEEAPLPAGLALLALVGAGFLVRRRR
ncbi:MAG: PEGA domain-containing protein [Methanospirillum sp.]